MDACHRSVYRPDFTNIPEKPSETAPKQAAACATTPTSNADSIAESIEHLTIDSATNSETTTTVETTRSLRVQTIPDQYPNWARLLFQQRRKNAAHQRGPSRAIPAEDSGKVGQNPLPGSPLGSLFSEENSHYTVSTDFSLKSMNPRALGSGSVRSVLSAITDLSCVLHQETHVTSNDIDTNDQVNLLVVSGKSFLSVPNPMNNRVAVSLFQKALELDPAHIEAHFSLGKCYCSGSGTAKDNIKAHYHFQLVLKYDEKHAWAHAYLGIILFTDKTSFLYNPDQAEFHLQKAIELDPTNAYTLAKMGGIQKYRGKYDEAEKYFDEALKYDPLEPFALSRKAHFLLKEKKISEAKAFLNRSFDRHPNDPYALGLYALILYHHEQKYDEASKVFKQGWALNPLDPYFPTMLGKISLLTEEYQLATVLFQQALQINPNLSDAQKGLKDAQKLLEQKKKVL